MSKIDKDKLFVRDFDSEAIWRFAISKYPEKLTDQKERLALQNGLVELELIIKRLGETIVDMQGYYFAQLISEDFAECRLEYCNTKQFLTMDFDQDGFIQDCGKANYQQLIEFRDSWLDALLERYVGN